MPILTVAPDYPTGMLARGAQGWVLVEFDVDELGRVQAPAFFAALRCRTRAAGSIAGKSVRFAAVWRKCRF